MSFRVCLSLLSVLSCIGLPRFLTYVAFPYAVLEAGLWVGSVGFIAYRACIWVQRENVLVHVPCMPCNSMSSVCAAIKGFPQPYLSAFWVFGKISLLLARTWKPRLAPGWRFLRPVTLSSASAPFNQPDWKTVCSMDRPVMESFVHRHVMEAPVLRPETGRRSAQTRGFRRGS